MLKIYLIDIWIYHNLINPAACNQNKVPGNFLLYRPSLQSVNRSVVWMSSSSMQGRKCLRSQSSATDNQGFRTLWTLGKFHHLEINSRFFSPDAGTFDLISASKFLLVFWPIGTFFRLQIKQQKKPIRKFNSPLLHLQKSKQHVEIGDGPIHVKKACLLAREWIWMIKKLTGGTIVLVN